MVKMVLAREVRVARVAMITVVMTKAMIVLTLEMIQKVVTWW